MEDMYSSTNQYFPDDQCIMLHNYACIRDSFKVPDGPTNFNVTEFGKFITVISEFMLQLTFIIYFSKHFCHVTILSKHLIIIIIITNIY